MTCGVLVDLVSAKKLSAEVSGGSAEAPSMEVCFIWVPLLISKIGLKAVGVAVVPAARKTNDAS